MKYRPFRNSRRRWLVLCVGFATACYALAASPSTKPASMPAAVATESLVAHWPFDETDGKVVKDLAAANCNGTIMRSKRLSGKFTTKRSDGIAGRGFFCGGGPGQYGYFVEIQRPPKLNAPLTGTLWIKSLHSQWCTRILYCRWASGQKLELRLDGTKLGLHICVPGQGKRILTSYMPVQTGYWAFVAFTWDASSARLYLNGMLVAQDDAHDSPPSKSFPAPATMRIGAFSPHTNNVFLGLIDEVRLWNRSLSEEDIARQMCFDLKKR